MNPFPLPKSSNAGVIVISLTALVVGFLGSVALATHRASENRFGRLPGDIRTGLSEEQIQTAEELDKVRKEVASLRAENSKLQKAASEGTGLSKTLSDGLERTKLFAGLTEVEGPGVSITLRDSRKSQDGSISDNDAIIHDTDVLRVINELWNAGAEAVSVNTKRVGPGTSYRCVGSVIVVDGVRFAAPIRIQAIGDPEALYGGLKLPGGILMELQDIDAEMAAISVVKKHRLKAFDGSLAKQWAKAPEEPSE